MSGGNDGEVQITSYARRMQSMSKKAPAIRDAIARVTRLKDLCAILKLAPSTLARHCEASDIEYPTHLKPWGTRSSLDKKIADEWPIPQMAAAEGMKPQRVHQYMFETNQLAKWKDGRKEVRRGKSMERREYEGLRALIIALVKRGIYQRAEQEGWACARAAEYELYHNIPGHPFENILTFFTRYQAAKEAGRKDSFRKLGEGLNMTFSQILSILEVMKLPSLQGKSLPRRLTQEEKERLERGLCLGMAASDIGYFSGVNEGIAQSFFRRQGVKSVPIILTNINDRKLNYRTASKIYEAHDAGLTMAEKAEYAGTNEQTVQYALDNRQGIEKKIISTLQFLFWDKSIDKPYYNSTKT